MNRYLLQLRGEDLLLAPKAVADRMRLESKPRIRKRTPLAWECKSLRACGYGPSPREAHWDWLCKLCDILHTK